MFIWMTFYVNILVTVLGLGFPWMEVMLHLNLRSAGEQIYDCKFLVRIIILPHLQQEEKDMLPGGQVCISQNRLINTE